MANTRTALSKFAANVDESMGVRELVAAPPLTPIASAKDVGRTPLRRFGRLNLDQVVTDPKQPRRDFNDEEIEKLAASIRKTGQLHPVRVRWDIGLEKWVIVTGERRFRAAVAAELVTIDCYFHDDDITESEILEQQLVENLLRQDLKPLEEARGYAALMEINGWNGKQVAAALHVSPSKVSRSLALLDLPEDVQSCIQSGDIRRTAAYELSKLDTKDAQQNLASEATGSSLTHRQTASAVRKRRGKEPRRHRSTRQTFLSENGIKVAVTASRKVTYLQVEQALLEALAEVRTRIDNNVQIY